MAVQAFTNHSGSNGAANQPTSYVAADGFVGAPVTPFNPNNPTFTAANFPAGMTFVAETISSTTPPVTRLLDPEVTLSGATVAVVGAGSIVGVKGGVTLNSGSTITSGFLYGAEGKLTVAGTLNNGSGYATGLLGQLNLSGATVTSGHVAALIANIQFPITSSLVNGIYVESSGPGVINSVLQSIANSAFVFDLAPDAGTSACINTTGTAGSTSTKGWLKVQVDPGTGPVTRYIPLSDTVS